MTGCPIIAALAFVVVVGLITAYRHRGEFRPWSQS